MGLDVLFFVGLLKSRFNAFPEVINLSGVKITKLHQALGKREKMRYKHCVSKNQVTARL
jgi:hypothetical protein